MKTMKYIKRMLAAGCIIAACAACSDMLETESTRQNIEPEINE